MEDVANYIFSKHSYKFNNFKESLEKYKFIYNNNEKYILFCRMTLEVIKHNLDDEEWRNFCNNLKDIINRKFTNIDNKTINEYKILRPYTEKFFDNIKIIKRESPDFEIILENGKKIGIEVTKLTDEIQAIIHKFTADVFGRGKSTIELVNIAKQRYKKRHRDIIIVSLSRGISCVGRNATDNVTEQHHQYAKKILEKSYKFKEWEKREHFEEKIILCESYSPISLTNELDFKEISDEIFNKEISIDCNAVIFSAYDGFNDNWGIIDLKNREIELSPNIKREFK
jgi:hypothetical protein